MNGNSMACALSVSGAGDRAGRLAYLFDRHHDRLYRLARRLAPSRDDALDLVQETFLRAAGALNSIPAGDGNEEAWLVRVLINIRRDQWRKTSVRDRHRQTEGRGARVADSGSEAAIIARTILSRSAVARRHGGAGRRCVRDPAGRG
jgi:RNA polymerase sigma-70 factor (ECF subfamily)